jgi:hypothetical protein
MSNARIEQRAKPVDATIAGDMNWDGEHINGMSEADVPLLSGLRPSMLRRAVGRAVLVSPAIGGWSVSGGSAVVAAA